MKTTEEIYNEIIAEKESGSYPELDELNSTSKVSIWRLWVWIFAFFSKTLWELFDDLKAWVIDYFAKNQIGTLQWWLSELYKFQFTDELEYIDNKFQYAVVDETKRIIKQAAIEVQNRILLIKVATDDENNDLTSLTPTQIDSLEGYVHKIKLPGTFTQVVSQNPALLNINYKIFYNAEIEQSVLTSQIENAIIDYLNNIVFNGKFIPTELTDKLQSIQGINNPVYISAEAKEQFSTDWTLIEDYYTSTAGYMQLNNLTLNYIAN